MARKARSLTRSRCEHFTIESFMQIKRKAKSKRGGARPNSGRPPKADKDQWVEANVRLRRDTVERLREGAGSKLFGKFLQEHLDRHPVPSHEEYLRLQTRRVRVPLSPEEREARELAKLSEIERLMLRYINIDRKTQPQEWRQARNELRAAVREEKKMNAKWRRERAAKEAAAAKDDVAGKTLPRKPLANPGR
jgi:hypothetical protein